MATEVSPGRFERESGEPCPRGSVVERGATPCRGAVHPANNAHGERVFLCDQCGYQWGVRFRVGDKDSKTGKAPRWSSIPERLVEALAKSNWDRIQALNTPDPRERVQWKDAADVSNHIRVAQETLGPVWSEFGTWFEEFFGIVDADAPAEKTARMLIQEIAIPTLRRYEEKYDTPDTPRVALEANLNARQEAA